MVGFKSKDVASHEHDEDLSTLLTADERVDLTLLISNITELMRKQITDNFDASISTKDVPHQAIHLTDGNPNVAADTTVEQTEEQKKAAVLQQKREKELSEPEMLGLRKDCLEFFENWRESVISRVGNVVNNPKKLTEEQQAQASAKATPKPEITSKPQVIGMS